MDNFSLETCKRNKMLNFELALEFFSLIKIHKILYTQTHLYFSNRLNNYQINHTINTRNNTQAHLTLPHMNYSKCQNAFIYKASQAWNKLPLSLRDQTNTRKFKNKLKNHLLNC